MWARGPEGLVLSESLRFLQSKKGGGSGLDLQCATMSSPTSRLARELFGQNPVPANGFTDGELLG